jgi:hypothetical protein
LEERTWNFGGIDVEFEGIDIEFWREGHGILEE